MRLIDADADALREHHCEGCSKETIEICKYDPICSSLLWVDEAPTVDAVEVVRCKDCKYHKNTSVKEREHCVLLGYTVDETDFCSYGERREYND